MRLDTISVKEALGTTGYFLKVLAAHGIESLADFMFYVPRVYEDRSEFTTLANAKLGETQTMKGTLSKLSRFTTKNRHKLIKAEFVDEEGGVCELVWFNQQHLYSTLKEDKTIVISGKLKYEFRKLTMMSPKFEYETAKHELIHFGKIVPIYPEMDRLSTDWFRRKMTKVQSYFDHITEILPLEVLQAHELIDRKAALYELHFPTNTEKLKAARRRMAFEELFLLQLKSLQKKLLYQHGAKEQSLSIPMDADLVKSFIAKLDFDLTEHQKIAAYSILKDMQEGMPMQRLLEGDVGSGKTVVATLTALHAIKKGGVQVALMAPTEVLATQHYRGITPLLAEWGIHTQFLSGSLTKSQKELVYDQIRTGTVDFVIGTHALIQDGVDFARLGMVIVDEQHRFGVAQREKLASHGFPHVLHMTATPIPRTLALTMYGDQDLSIISQMPKGRKTIITRIVPPHQKEQMYLFIKDQIAKGRQVYVICPLIEESEKMQEVKAVTEEFAFLEKHIFKEGQKVTLLHGKMSAEQKDVIMRDFNDKKYDVLVSTSVIEVGINVPNATVMVIEGSERFGLSQLHQLRGRVGRGEHQSYCFLSTEKSHAKQIDRLRAMEKHHDGFTLAEIDLELRGPGEVYGVRQSGLPDLRLADLKDLQTIVDARESAKSLLEKNLSLDQYPRLQQLV